MKSIINKIMRHPELLSKPPVLVDVGASGGLPTEWRFIAPYSIGVVFDADTRDFSVGESEAKGYKKLYSLNRLVGAKPADSVEFFMTQSPYCSSSLRPDSGALKPWAFSRLFDVKKVIRMPAVDLNSALAVTGFDYIDWYKTDTQGTDLRIFDALPSGVIEKALVAEFEPGIIDAYVGEDKLYQLMAYMDKKPFWVTHMEVKGSQRIDQIDLAELNAIQSRSISSFLKMAPGWCEISYINDFEEGDLECREFLLGWVFSTIKREHGFALRIAKIGSAKFNEPLFDELVARSQRSLSDGYIKVAVKAIKKLGRMAAGAGQ
jgi:hypothetical protein